MTVPRLAFRRRSLSCREVVELVTDYLEDAMSAADRRRFERHLRDCPNCTRYLEQMRLMIRRSGTVVVDELSPEARDELTRRFRDWREGPG